MKWCPLLLTALCVSSVAFADTISLNPVADASISENNAANPNAMPGNMIVGHLDPINANVMSRGLLRFDLSGIPVGSTITSAVLAVTVTINASANADTHALHRMNAPWVEATVTWISSGFEEWFNGGDYEPVADSTVVIPVGVGANTFPSTAGLVNTVQLWVNDTNSNHGWVLRSNSEAGGRNARRFTTREEGATLPQPVLTVGYFPPPPTTNLTNARVADGKFKFDFTAVGGFSYIAQYKEALQPGDWTDFAWYPDPATSTVITVEHPLTTTNRFYRIVVATWP